MKIKVEVEGAPSTPATSIFISGANPTGPDQVMELFKTARAIRKAVNAAIAEESQRRHDSLEDCPATGAEPTPHADLCGLHAEGFGFYRARDCEYRDRRIAPRRTIKDRVNWQGRIICHFPDDEVPEGRELDRLLRKSICPGIFPKTFIRMIGGNWVEAFSHPGRLEAKVPGLPGWSVVEKSKNSERWVVVGAA